MFQTFSSSDIVAEVASIELPLIPEKIIYKDKLWKFDIKYGS